jgi:hypothetical protein
MLSLFRLAIPEINEEETEVFFVKENPWISPEGEAIELKEYRIQSRHNSTYIFTIGRYIPYLSGDYVLVKRIPFDPRIMETAGEYYILEIADPKYIPDK